jgi:hypothetical protein
MHASKSNQKMFEFWEGEKEKLVKLGTLGQWSVLVDWGGTMSLESWSCGRCNLA